MLRARKGKGFCNHDKDELDTKSGAVPFFPPSHTHEFPVDQAFGAQTLEPQGLVFIAVYFITINGSPVDCRKEDRGGKKKPY